MLAPPGLAIPELCRFGASQLAALLVDGKVSSREIVTAFLDHIDSVNPAHNAIVSLRDRKAILAEADAADERLRARGPDGLLHGLPIAIKDLAATKGLRTTFGSPIHADFVPDADSLTVARIRAAGAIVIGKTNTPEFGLGSHTYNPVFGTTRNAFGPSRSAGGSSGGAAVALALRMLPVADGSDMGGSLRNPAAYNNVYGMRPSQGRVPNAGSEDLFYSQLSTDGAMARSVADLAGLLAIEAGPDPRAPLSLQDGLRWEPGVHARPGRIAWLGDLGGHLPMEAGVLDVCELALSRLADAGCTIEPVLPKFDWERLWSAFVVLRQFSIAGKYGPLHDDPATRDLLKPEMGWEIENGRHLGAEAIYAAARTRSEWYLECLRLFEHFDALALPSAQLFAFDADWHWPREIAGRTMDSYHRWMEVVAPGTLSGCPVISLPAGFGSTMRPMGMQLIGRPKDDIGLLGLAELYA
ncbi:amidase [Aurantimonas endophytica]|uniref:amidase n=1 Tax=Aurantimonas endophytica TaxID=1522175 RepID=UPI003AB98778